MFERLLRFAIEQRVLVLLATLALAALGLFSFQKLAIDAVPDITNVQVQINSQAPGYSPLEVEQRITYPLETVMAGLPGLSETRSLSRYGLSQVTVIFKDGTDIYFARQLVNQRLTEAATQLPAGITPQLGPISTGLGEIYLWTVEAQPGAKKSDGSAYSITDLREIQDWIIRPQMRQVPGVAEVNSIGGYAKQFQVAPDPAKLQALGLSFGDLVQALESNNANQGAGYIERQGEQWLVRVPGQLQGIEDIRNIVLKNVGGAPLRLQDVATVALGEELRSGAATENGRETVLGTVFMLMGENSRSVAAAAHAKLQAINKTLPAGIRAQAVYDRTTLVDKAMQTVARNLVEGALLVIAVLFIFLGNIRAALITAAVIPLSMLLTFSGMVSHQVSANLMSLGALDFGIIVDGAVVIVENCIRRLSHAQTRHGGVLDLRQRLQEVFAAAQEARRPLLYGQLIIMVVYLPIFALTGVEGKMFHPMALTVVMALAAAMLLSLTFVPAAVALWIRGPVQEKEGRALLAIKARYAPLLSWVMGNKPVVFTAAATAVLLSVLMATRLGSEFVPSLNEGDLAIQALRLPGTGLTQSLSMQQSLEKRLLEKFPEIQRVFARTGTAEIASDPMPPNISDGYIMLRPERDWPQPRRTRPELIAAIQAEVAQLPGQAYEFSQPIQLRFNELISGVRADVAVKIFGDDMALLNRSALAVAAQLQQVPGTREVKIEQTSGLPMLSVNIDRAQAGRLGLNVAAVQEAVATAIGGRQAGTIFQGDRRFDLVVRLPENLRTDLSALGNLPLAVAGADGRLSFVPLSAVAELSLKPGPNQISRENGKRRIVISANVQGRDIGGFVREAQGRLENVPLPAGYWSAWGGQFEQLQAAMASLQVVVPLALGLVLLLLFAMFGNLKDGLLVFTGIPFALTGGVLALFLRDMPFSITAGIGFIALSGVAVLNGLVMISFIRPLLDQGHALREAVQNGALTRLRPVLMTALVAALGFVPMALATGTGAEVQRPLATVVIGGIISSTLLTLLVLPALYHWAYRRTETNPPQG